MRRITIPAFFIITLLIISSCNRDNEYSLDIEKTTLGVGYAIEGHLNGQVVDQNNQSISGALVTVDGKETRTDQNGFYRFEDIILSSTGTLIKVGKENFFDGYKFGYVEPGENSMIRIKMVNNPIVATYDGEMDKSITLQDGGGRMVLPGGGLGYSDNGEAYTGTVYVRAYWYDPQYRHMSETMPGDLRAITSNGDLAQLITLGMMVVHLEDENGSKLQIRDGYNAKVSFPVDPNALRSDSIPMWHLDEQSGYWIEEEMAYKEGDRMVAEISHFSNWNCAYQFAPLNINGRLLSGGIPLSDQIVTITDLDGNVSGQGFTNESGIFSGGVPADEELFLTYLDCQDEKQILEIGALYEDTALDDIDIGSDNNILKLMARLVDCGNQPNEDAYVLLRTTEGDKIISPRRGGIINSSFVGCVSEEVTVQGFDIKTLLTSELITHVFEEPEHDFESLEMCSGLASDGILFGIGGFRTPLAEAQVTLLDDGTHFCIWAKEDLTGNYVKFVYPLLDGAVFPDVYFRAFNEMNNPTYASASESNLIVTMTSESPQKIGDYVVGTVRGKNSIRSIDFRLPVTKIAYTSSIKGKAWYDADEDGLREAGESPIKQLSFSLTKSNPQQDFASYFEDPDNGSSYLFVSDEQGDYLISGIVGDTDYQVTAKSTGSQLTIQGGDSEFFFNVQNGDFRSESIFIGAGEDLNGPSIGLLP